MDADVAPERRNRGLRRARIAVLVVAVGLSVLAFLLVVAAWQNESSIEIVADYNAQPPLGIGGIEATDKGKDYGGKLAFGALGIGGLKLKLHRACIGKLFESSDRIFDAEEIYALAKEMA